MWKRFGLLVCCAFLVLFGISENANALEVGEVDYRTVNTSRATYRYQDNPGYQWSTTGSLIQNGRVPGRRIDIGTTNNVWGNVDGVYLDLGSSYVPENSLVSFDIRFVVPNYTESVYYSNVSLADGIMLSEQCTVTAEAEHSSTSTSAAEIQCHYLGITGSYSAGNGWNPIGISGNVLTLSPDGARIFTPDKVYYATLTASAGGGGSSQDYNQQLNNIRYLQQDQYNRLVDILSNLNDLESGQLTPAQVETSLNNALNDAMDAEKEEIQDAADDAQDAVDDAQDTIESDTASITDQIGTIIGIIKDTPATNCNINGNMGNVNLGTMDMCQGVPQSIRDIIVYVASGVLVLAILRLAYSLVKVYLGYLQSYTGGNE